MTRRVAPALVFAAALLAGCGDDETTAPSSSDLILELSGLEPLAGGWHYEGWAILGGPVSTGKFDVGSGSQLVDLAGNPIAGNRFATGRDLSGASAIVVTIEPAGDTDAIPAATKYLGGDVMGGATAALRPGHAAALGDDFASATGKYILATPTNATGTDENSGIWFLSLETGGPTVGLALPALPAGWRYEGWAVIAGTPVTTGTFTDPAAADAAAPYSDPAQSGPPFPGEDFLRAAPSPLVFPTDLAGGRAVISIEPDPDPSPAPFTLKPLNGPIAAGAMDHVTYDMPNAAAQFPSGTATIR